MLFLRLSDAARKCTFFHYGCPKNKLFQLVLRIILKTRQNIAIRKKQHPVTTNIVYKILSVFVKKLVVL